MTVRTAEATEDRALAWAAGRCAPGVAGHLLAILGHFEAVAASDERLAATLALHLADTFTPAPASPAMFKDWLRFELERL